MNQSATARKRKLTPPELARQWGISPTKIIGWILAGELRAIDASATRGGRPRYLIDIDDVADFERRRAASPPPPAPRRTARPTTCKNYF